MKIIRNCLTCNEEFETLPCYIKSGGGKFCSMPCYRKNRKGKPTWNKGLPATWSIGNKHRLGLKSPNSYFKVRPPLNEENTNWKGDDVGYFGLHGWVRRKLGTPYECSHCHRKDLQKRQYHWANKSGQYLRNLTDWIRLCVKCHKAYDTGKLKLY